MPSFDSMSGNVLRAYRSKRFRYSLLALLAALAVFAAIVGYHTWQIWQSELPSFEQLHNIEQRANTKVYDRNGELIHEFYAENRVLTPFKEFPPHLVEILLASEDQEFYNHWGLNLRRVAVVAATNLLKWKIEAGASTITQQVARMLFLSPEQTMSRKVKEALTAVKLERTYSKQEIIEMYLNQHYFSRGAYGVSAAARLFFNKQVSELTISESATLIGLLKGPNINSPLNNMEKGLQARNRVLYSYFTVGGITRQQFDSLKDVPIKLVEQHKTNDFAAYFAESIRQYLREKYGEEVLYAGGLKVFTSLDARLQRVAEESVGKRIDSLRSQIERTRSLSSKRYTEYMADTADAQGDSIRVFKRVQGAFVAIDNATGDVIALVGGRSFAESEFNRATQSLRQPGSAFKPFVYTACIDNGYKPTDIIDDSPIVLEIPGSKEWRPNNYDEKFLGPLTIRDALRQSRNLVAIRLLLKIQPDEAIFYARKMGISSPLEAVPSLAVGASEVRLIELVSAYSVFPNGGIRVPYRMVHKVIDRYNRVLEQNTRIAKEEVLSSSTAFIMTDLLRSVVDEGTGRRARSMGFVRPAGGKTGTSNNFCDNWFVGFTPQVTAGSWVGFDDLTSLGSSEDGARNAVPTWAEFMQATHDTLPILDFEQPADIVRAYVCLESGELATDRCHDVRSEVFTIQGQPSTTCHIHPSRGRYRPEEKARSIEPLDTTTYNRTQF